MISWDILRPLPGLVLTRENMGQKDLHTMLNYQYKHVLTLAIALPENIGIQVKFKTLLCKLVFISDKLCEVLALCLSLVKTFNFKKYDKKYN